MVVEAGAEELSTMPFEVTFMPPAAIIALVIDDAVSTVAVVVDNVVKPSNVLLPAIVCELVDIKPRAFAPASGRLNECTELDEVIEKSAPVVPVTNV